MEYFFRHWPRRAALRRCWRIFWRGAGHRVRSLPGLTAVMGVALLIPLTFGLPPVVAFSSLLGMYCGAIYAGSITAILSVRRAQRRAATMLEGPR